MPRQIPARLQRFKRQLILGNLAMLALAAAVIGWQADTGRRSHEARARQTAIGLAQTLSLSVSASFKGVDDRLQSLLKRLDDLPGKGSPDPQALANAAEAERALLPMVEALRVTDANGLVLNPGDRPAISMADRDYFRAAKVAPTQMAVSEPQRGRIVGGWGLVLARARSDADGRFLGVVYASIKTERLRDAFKRAEVGAQGAVTLRSRSLQLIARHSPRDPDSDAGTGTIKVSESLLAALAQDPMRGSVISRTALDGVERVTAYEAVPDLPMLLLVGLATEDFYAGWRREVGLLAGGLLLLQALLAGLSVVAYRRRARSEPPA